MMTQAKLIETIEAYRKGETCLNGLLADVDAYSAASNIVKLPVMCWREFKNEKPEPLQWIWVYASYFVEPETRKLTVDDLKQNWDGLYWMPVVLPACK